eukprot:TRINITY_DN17041_c0_g2_i1.p1 TRINITY_DN17041_c0_g2~~TRINITY_DN17041_c0_g2_i1.p1  ORF type:complete len:1220 (-),score=161.77 TRINITY_DN17041_c0_g2_i1:138-3770(-)
MSPASRSCAQAALLACCAALGAGVDWVAWSGDIELGPPSDSRSGWQSLRHSEQLQHVVGLDEGIVPNSYRFFHPNASCYVLGTWNSTQTPVEVWQPYGETSSAAVGANIRGALWVLYHDRLDQYYVILRNVPWSNLSEDPICQGGESCPDVILTGSAQLPGQVAAQKVRPLTRFLENYQQTHMMRLEDDFPHMAFYQYNIKGKWMAVPFVSDTRLLGFNRTTLDTMGVDLPPPHNQHLSTQQEWTWERLANLACNISQKHGHGSGLVISSGWEREDDFNLFMLMEQAEGHRLVERTGHADCKNGTTLQQRCGLANGTKTVDKFWRPVIQQRCMSWEDGGADWDAFSKSFQPDNSSDSVLIRSSWRSEGPGRPQRTGFFVTSGIDDTLLMREILYADMPGEHSYLGGAGLILPRRAGAGANSSCSAKEGWKIILELVDRNKPWMLQANTMKAGRLPPPVASTCHRPPFNSWQWKPAVRALARAIPSQYPSPGMPQIFKLQREQPVRWALVKAVLSNISASEVLAVACTIVDEALRPCNISNWHNDTRCTYVVDGLQGCPAGHHLTPEEYGELGCRKCGQGNYSSQRNVHSKCIPCPRGRHAAEHGTTHCTQCSNGKVALTTGWAYCSTCSRGQVPAQNGEACSPCPVGKYQEGFFCAHCPAGKTTSHPEQWEESLCDWSYPQLAYGLELALVLIIILLVHSLPLLLGCPVAVQDIYMDDGCVVVKTWGSHRIFKHSPLPIKVKLRSTGHPAADSRTVPFMARVRDFDEIMLLDEKGPVTESINSSKGKLQLAGPCKFLHASWAIPVLGHVPVLLSDAILLCGFGVIVHMMSTDLTPDDHYKALVVFLGTAVALAVSIPVHWFIWHSSFKYRPLARKRHRFRQRLLTRHAPSSCERGPGRAIGADKLVELLDYFHDYIRNRDMYYVAANLLRPLTKPDRLSYAELVGPHKVTWFVSHYWGMKFKDFVSSLQNMAVDACVLDWTRSRFWVCSFSNNQWKLVTELGGGNPLESSFYLALQSPSCQGTAMVLDEHAHPLKRSWCLFEILQTCKLTCQRGDAFDGLLFCAPTGVLQHGEANVDTALALAKNLSGISLKNATATRQEDKDMIDAHVVAMDGGFEKVDKFVRDCIKGALEVVHGTFEEDFSRLLRALSSTASPQSRSSTRLLGRNRLLPDPKLRQPVMDAGAIVGFNKSTPALEPVGGTDSQVTLISI